MPARSKSTKRNTIKKKRIIHDCKETRQQQKENKVAGKVYKEWLFRTTIFFSAGEINVL